MKLHKRIAVWICTGLAAPIAVAIAPLRWIRKVLTRNRVLSLWTGKPIINMGINARAERLLGVLSRSLVFSTYHVSEEFDFNLERLSRIPLMGKLLPFPVFVLVCMFADRIHLYCDQGVLPSARPFRFNPIELPIYRLLGIEMFFWTYGADVRSRGLTRSLGEPNCCTDCTIVGQACRCNDQHQAENYKYLQRFSKAVFAMGDMQEYTPGSRNDLFFWPVDLSGARAARYAPAYPSEDAAGPVRIVHAPNHRMFKGTRYLIDAVDELRKEGLKLELILVEKVPNQQALEIYRSADIIFDQCLVGFHGYFALEAMALGKPVVCFIRKPNEYLLKPEECPMILTTPQALKRDLRSLVERRSSLREIGVRGRDYIKAHHSLEAFATRLKTAYEEIGA